MRKLGLLFILVVGGCLGSYGGGDSSQQQRREEPADMAEPVVDEVDLAEPADLTPPPDLAEPPDLTPPGPKPFGGDCAAPTDCEQGLRCEVFTIMGTPQGKCTRPCTIANQAQTCTKPPSTGICTSNQVCGF